MRVGQTIRRRWKYQNDSIYREKCNRRRKEYNRKHRLKELQRFRKWDEEMNKYRNRHCKLCGKLLHWHTKGDYCRECLLSNSILKNV